MAAALQDRFLLDSGHSRRRLPHAANTFRGKRRTDAHAELRDALHVLYEN